MQENGGAIALAAGGTFCLALTARGKVIVWGKIGGPAGQRGTRPAVAEIMGLPRITSIAAGQSHALMTDGERVWALGRYSWYLVTVHFSLLAAAAAAAAAVFCLKPCLEGTVLWQLLG